MAAMHDASPECVETAARPETIGNAGASDRARWQGPLLAFNKPPRSAESALAAPEETDAGIAPLSGAAIRLAPVSERMGIAEGIETALAAAELFGLPVWSCISTSGIESFEPPDGVREVVIFADNDLNFAGQKAAFAAAHRLKFYAVDVRTPPVIGDWLDVLIAWRQIAE